MEQQEKSKLEKKDYEYILFDLDGTLTDPLESFGIHVEDLDSLCKFIGPPLKESFMVYYGLDDAQGDQAVEKYRERFAVTGLFENKVYPGIREMLELLKEQGKTLLVATSKPSIYARQILEHFDLM